MNQALQLLSLFLLGTAVAAPAAAYPQYIAKTYTNCVTCHYSPSGGGLLNAYGHATILATVPDELGIEALMPAREFFAKNSVTGVDDDERAALQWDVGVDIRLMEWLAPKEAGEGPTAVFIPMLIEAGGVLAYGPALAYATLTMRRLGAAGPPDSADSREHWLMYKLDETSALRAGRLVLPYGLRIPDHTQYTRADLGFDKWHGSYGLEYDLYSSAWMVSLALAAGDLLHEPLERQERGLAASVVYNFPARASVGASALALVTANYYRAAAGLLARVRPWQRLYAMGELSWQRTQILAGDAATSTSVAYLRGGYFVLESLDLFGEWGAAVVPGAPELTKLKYALGLDWKPIPWIELSLLGGVEERVETGQTPMVLGQFHFIY